MKNALKYALSFIVLISFSCKENVQMSIAETDNSKGAISAIKLDRTFSLLISEIVELGKMKSLKKVKDIDEKSLFTELGRARSEQDAHKILSKYFEHPEAITGKINKILELGIKLKTNNSFLRNVRVDSEGSSKLLAQAVSEELKRIREQNLARAKTTLNDCAGTCSQQFNIDMNECDGGLALGIAAALIGGMANPMVGAGGLLVVGVGYLVCEAHSLETLGTCFDGCSR